MTYTHPEPGRGARSYVFRYTLLFLVMSALVFLPFLLAGRSLVNRTDGMSQYIVYLRYMGQYIRSAVSGFLHGDFIPPAYDFSIGLGDDIGQIVRFHPLDFLSAFVPAGYTEYLYGLILFIRFYLAGLAFSAYAFLFRKESTNVLSGAMVYVFCGYMLIRAVNHPTYAAPFIVLPLILYAAEQVMKGRGLALFSFSVFLGFWSNYYFMYIMSIGLFVYMTVRFFDVYRQDRVKAFFTLFLKMILLYILGLLMSMMTLLPTLLRYFSSTRTSEVGGGGSLLYYKDVRRYAAWFINLISPYRGSGNGTNLNYAVIVLPCLAVLFSLAWKKYRTLKILLIANLMILLIPAAGFVLAAFNRENSRWIFLMALCLGMTVVLVADSFAHLEKKQMLSVLAVWLVFLLGVAAQTYLEGANIFNLTAAAELTVCVLLLLSPILRKRGVSAVRTGIMAITCISVVINSFLTYSPGFGAEAERYVEAGQVIPQFENFFRSRGEALIDDDSFYRVEGRNLKHGRENSGAFSGYNGTSEYNSILNPGMMESMMDINDAHLDAVTTMRGMDARPVSLNLAHVKYYISREEDGQTVPFGFDPVPAYEDGDVKVYECSMPLSFGYSCDSYITRENYEALSDLEQEMVQLEAVVCGEDDGLSGEALSAAGLKEITGPEVQITREEAVPAAGKGAVLKDGVVRVKKSRGSISIPYQMKEGHDTYILLEGLTFDEEKTNLDITAPGVKTSVNVRNEDELYTLGREDYLVHLGYCSEDGEAQAEISFRKKGRYTLSGVSVYSVPMDRYEERIADLNSQALSEERVLDGEISGKVSFDSDRLLVFSVPYANGWTLEVDGEETEIIKANVMYQGALIGAGKHTIHLYYRTPGDTAGKAMAIPAIALWVMLALCERRKRKELYPDKW